MMRQIILILCLSCIFSTSLSFAAIYKWIDEKGIVHYTDDILQIPEKDRPKAEEIGLPEGKGEKKIEGEDLAPKKKEDTYKDRLGRGEEYWRGRVDEWRKKLRVIQEKVEDLRMRYNELTEKYNDSKSAIERVTLRREREQLKSEMDQNKMQIEEIKNILEKKIPEEAELYKAKPEWIK
jgi:hypothetical protein